MDAFDAWPCLHCTDHVSKVRPVQISHIGRSALICVGYVWIRTAMRKLPTARTEVTKVYCNWKEMVSLSISATTGQPNTSKV